MTKRSVKIIIVITLNLLTSSVVCAKGWHGIVPLRSTRAEVERLIGKPTLLGGSVYGLKDEVVIIHYSQGGCDDINRTKWNVPLNTVITITVNPRARFTVQSLSFDLDAFKRVNDPEVEDAIYFVNDKDGISILSRPSDDAVISVIYTPTEADHKFRCKCASEEAATQDHSHK